MRVHRLVFRLDFQHPNFELINSPGTVMKILNEMGDNYWPELKDDSANRRVAASHTDTENGHHRQITAEPTVISFVLESVKGINLDSLDTNETLNTMFKAVHLLRETFKINEIQRAGIRFTILNDVGGDNARLDQLFTALYDEQIVDIATSTLGNIKDSGISLDGESADKIKFHCKFGPYEAIESSKFFTAAIAKLMGDIHANVIFDLDLFEEKFAMTINAAKWRKAPTQKVKNFVSNIEASLLERL